VPQSSIAQLATPLSNSQLPGRAVQVGFKNLGLLGSLEKPKKNY